MVYLSRNLKVKNKYVHVYTLNCFCLFGCLVVFCCILALFCTGTAEDQLFFS